MSTSNKASSKKAPAAASQTVAPVVETQAAGTTAAATATTVVVAVKAPSKVSLAKPIFDAGFAIRQQQIKDNVPMDQRTYKTNKDFRLGTCETVSKTLGVSMASAGSMYNSWKIEIEKVHTDAGLGRDPKKEKPAPKKAKVVVTTEAGATEAGALNTSATDSPAQEPAAV